MASTDHIDLDLDSAQRDVTYKPFAFVWKGRRIEFTDAAELDYTQLLEVETPVGFIRYVASQEDRDFLANEGKMEGWRLNLLMERYYKHFGLDKDRKKLGF